MTTFADALRAERERAGLTQHQLSKLSDVSRSYISLLEAGHKPAPPDSILIALAEALGVDIDAMFVAANRLPGEITIDMDTLRSMRLIHDFEAEFPGYRISQFVRLYDMKTVTPVEPPIYYTHVIESPDRSEGLIDGQGPTREAAVESLKATLRMLPNRKEQP